MNPTYSVLHATYGRPAKAIAAMRMFRDRAKQPEDVEYIFAVNQDDKSLPELEKLLKEEKEKNQNRFNQCFMVVGDYLGSAAAWNDAAMVSSGKILIQGQDDVEPPNSFDLLITEAVQKSGAGERPKLPFAVAVSDGYRRDALLCTAIMSRDYMEMEGCFLFPSYESMYSDDEYTIRAIANAADGKALLIEARDIVMLHRHCYFDKSVPEDSTYLKENSPRAYSVGLALFLKRNQRLLDRGFRTW